MMNYLAKHSIMELTFPKLAKCLTADTKILTAIEITTEDKLLVDVTQLGMEIKTAEVFYFQSYTGGGVNFPPMSNVYKITLQDYADEIRRYLQNLQQNHLILLHTKGRYTIVMLEVLSQVAKEVGKKISVFAIEAFEYEGAYRKMFPQVWQHINHMSDHAMLYESEKMLSHFHKEISIKEIDKKTTEVLFYNFYNNIAKEIPC